jgi:CspA family cold shock protein
MAMTGTVKFFNGERGYGFIKPDDGGRDVFVHITAVERAGLKSLMEGQRISFEVEPDKKGQRPSTSLLPARPSRSRRFNFLRREPYSRVCAAAARRRVAALSLNFAWMWCGNDDFAFIPGVAIRA